MKNNLVVSIINRNPYTVAHDLGHLLLDQAEHDTDPLRYNLMVGGTSDARSLGAKKRLRAGQATIMKTSLLVK